MAIVVANSFEGLTPSGTTLTQGSGGNTGGGSGNFFDVVSLGTGGSVVSANSPVKSGSLACTITMGSAGSALVAWTTQLFPSSGTQLWYRVYFNFPATPTGNMRMTRALNGGTLCAVVGIESGGHTFTMDSTGARLKTGGVVLATNTWHRWDVFVQGDAAAGIIVAQVFAGANVDGTTPSETISSTNINTSGALNRVDFGNPASQASWAVTLDNLTGSTQGPVATLNTLSPPVMSFMRTEIVSRSSSRIL